MRFFFGFYVVHLFVASMVMAIKFRDNPAAQHEQWNMDNVMTFKGMVGGHPIEWNGTAQEVIAAAVENYPGLDLQAFTQDRTRARAARSDALRRRALHDSDAYMSGRICVPVPGQSWSTASRASVLTNIAMLQDVDGWCGVSAGPGSCIRVAVTQDKIMGGCSSIFLCNDDTWSKNFDCGWIADITMDLIDNCPPEGYDDSYTGGQEFWDTASHSNNGKINVVVSRGNC